MHEIWVYLDESGSLDFAPRQSKSPYFAFGSATFQGDHDHALMQTVKARASRAGLKDGFHAYDDSPSTRTAFFAAIGGMDVEFDATFMAKEKAYLYVQQRPKIWLYKYTLYKHLGYVLERVRRANSTVHIVAAHMKFEAKQEMIHAAIRDVCQQMERPGISVIEHIWSSRSSAGLRVADYGLWATQRVVTRGQSNWWYAQFVEDKLKGIQYPWGRGTKTAK